MSPVTVPASQRTSVDLLDPHQASAALGIDETELIRLVNQAELAAYNIGGQIRFRSRDVSSLVSRSAIAA